SGPVQRADVGSDVQQLGGQPATNDGQGGGHGRKPTIWAALLGSLAYARLVDFDLSPEQEAFRKVVRDFAEGEIAPHAEAWDRDHTFPVDTVLAMGELGLFGLPFPEEYGGANADFTTLCLAIEELGRIDSSMAITLSAGVGLGANPIFRFGTEEQRRTWLPDLCA